MAITVLDVKGASFFGPTQQLAAFGTNPSNGDLIVVVVTVFSLSGTINLPTDTAGNTYVRLGTTKNQGGAYLGMFYAANIVGGATFRVTANVSATFHCTAAAWAVSGVGTAPYNGDWAFATGSSTTPGATMASAPSTTSFVLAGLALDSGNVPTDGSGWNATGVNGVTAGMVTQARWADYAANMDGFSEYKVDSAVASSTWTVTSSPWVVMQASFAASSGGGGSAGASRYRSRFRFGC